MQAVTFDRIGEPEDVLELSERPRPAPGPGQVLVRMTQAGINPGDFLFVRNQYPEPKKPKFPGQIAGNHGAGVVEAAGAGVTLAVGTRVAFSYFEAWSEYAIVPEPWLIPLPQDFAPDLGAQLFNLITAWDLVELARARPGDWIASTAGNSTVAILIAQYAAARGVRVLSLVRRRGPRDLLQLGAAAVIETEAVADLDAAILEATGGANLRAAIDGVGGPAFSVLARRLELGGRAVIYGGLHPEPFQLHAYDVLLNAIDITSYIYRYFFKPPGPDDAAYLQQLFAVSSYLDLQVPVAGRHALSDFRAAVEETLKRPEQGKRFFRMAEA
jgi:NADPH:quinone reductase-like Zn-dependent oxidoreductase